MTSSNRTSLVRRLAAASGWRGGAGTRRFPAVATCAFAACLFLAAGAPLRAAAPTPDTTGPILTVPGGVSGFAKALGVDPDIPRARLLTTAVRVLWESPEGTDAPLDRRRAQVLDYLRQAAAAAPGEAAAAKDGVPAFLPLDTWRAMTPRTGGAGGESVPLLTAILGSRQAALLYHGVASLDPSTRAFLVAHPDVLKRAGSDACVGTLATMGRSLHVKEGRIDVPGGASAVPLWEELAGERVTDPAAFFLRVLTQHGGRLALLYDGVAHLDEGARSFALGLQLPADERPGRFRRLYRASGQPLVAWDPSKRPFQRMTFDLVQLLLSVPFAPATDTSVSSSRALWEAVFEQASGEAGLPKDGSLGAGPRLDAARLAELLLVPDTAERRRRCQAWLFAGRVFGEANGASASDLLLALRGYGRYPSLLLTLERLGVRKPNTYALAVQAAGRFSAADAALRQFQAGLAILERATTSRAIGGDVAERLVLSLCSVTPDAGGSYRGAMARWLERDFLSAAGAPRLPAYMPADDRPLEVRVLAAMAGAVTSPANSALLALAPVEWEGLLYRVDPAAATLRRLREVRGKQGGPSLDAVLAFARGIDALREASSPAQTAAAAGTLQEAGKELEGTASFDEALSDTLRRLKSSSDDKAKDGAVRRLDEALDEQLAAVLVSVAYAPHLGDPDNPALFGGDPSRNHELRVYKPGTEMGRATVWDLPSENQYASAPWHVAGSLLGLDVALGRLALRRVPRETMPRGPRVYDSERQAFTESAAIMTPFDIAAGRLETLLAAVRRGRERLTAWSAAPSDTPAIVREAELDEWRSEALSWTVAFEPERVLGLFSLAELARLGGLDASQAGALDPWGTSGLALERGLASRYPVRLPWTTMAGRRGVHCTGALVPDIAIALAEALADRRLPLQLLPGIMLVATRDYLDTLQEAHEDDWLSMVAHAGTFWRGHLDDYVAALTVGGPLVPDGEDGGQDSNQ